MQEDKKTDTKKLNQKILLIASLSSSWYLIIADRQPDGITQLIKVIMDNANATNPKSSGSRIRAE